MGYSPRGRKELDMTKRVTHTWAAWLLLTNSSCINPGFPSWLSGKGSPCYAGDVGLYAGSRFSGVGNSNPLQYSCLGDLTDRGAWQVTVHGVAKSRT